MTPDTTPPSRIGRDLLFDCLEYLHIDHMFGVPGTNEIPIIDGAMLLGEGAGGDVAELASSLAVF